MSLPELPNNTGKKGKRTLPDGQVVHHVILDEIRIQQTNYPNKVIYLQEMQYDDGRIELRLCYYIIGKKPGMKGKWVFGQFATLMPAEDFRRIVDEAAEKGWI